MLTGLTGLFLLFDAVGHVLNVTQVRTALADRWLRSPRLRALFF